MCTTSVLFALSNTTVKGSPQSKNDFILWMEEILHQPVNLIIYPRSCNILGIRRGASFPVSSIGTGLARHTRQEVNPKP